ncbi:MAG TPA: Lrp/AsnC ligand binding domain-containing protein [Rhodoferax sp.]|nr:Lrp/AsnC ligand binding domain-containing protein [Rhodoferax sp.]
MSGRYDYQLEVVGVDLESFAEFVRTHIRALPGVREISTSFSLKEIKRSIVLPIA